MSSRWFFVLTLSHHIFDVSLACGRPWRITPSVMSLVAQGQEFLATSIIPSYYNSGCVGVSSLYLYLLRPFSLDCGARARRRHICYFHFHFQDQDYLLDTTYYYYTERGAGGQRMDRFWQPIEDEAVRDNVPSATTVRRSTKRVKPV